jgi:hypothetical protein
VQVNWPILRQRLAPVMNWLLQDWPLQKFSV